MAGVLALIAIPCVGIADAAQTCNSAITPSTPDTSYDITSTDGTITNARTGLTWKKCAEGQTYSTTTNTCSGTATTYSWQQALQHARAVNRGTTGESLGETDWRVPNIKELRSLVEQACYGPAINLRAFPVTPSPGLFWSSSPSAAQSGSAWGTDFNEGDVLLQPMDTKGYVRLVRGGL